MSHIIGAWTEKSALLRWGDHCKWGRWAEVIAKEKPATEGHNVTTGLLSHADARRIRSSSSSSSSSSSEDVEMDPELWGHLQDHIDLEEMVIAKLPLHAFYRSLSVCKKWSHLLRDQQFLERSSSLTSSLPKPYFILYGGQQACHQAMLVQDGEKWALKALPSDGFRFSIRTPDFQFHVARGVVYTANFHMGTVLNLHTKRLHCLPSSCMRVRRSGCAFAKLAVENRLGTSYKVLTVWCQYRTHSTAVYDSVTGEWTQKPTPCPKLVGSELDSTYCEGVMYMKCGNTSRIFRPSRHCHSPSLIEPKMLAYNFEHDSWTVLPLPPDGHEPAGLNIRRPAAMHPYGPAPRPAQRRSFGPLMQGLGEWRGVLRDLTLTEEGGLRVWEFQQDTQTWIEVDRMPTPMLEWFLIEPHSLRVFLRNRFVEKIKTCYCEHYILISRHDFAETSGLARFVLYDMERKSWETLNVAKNWICNCMPMRTWQTEPTRPVMT